MEIDIPGGTGISMNSPMSEEDMFASSQDMFADSEQYTKANGSNTSSSEIEVPQCSKTETNVSSVAVDSLNKDVTWRGTPLSKLSRNTGKDQFPPVVVGPQHTVLFKLPVREGVVPTPWPEKSQDKWDQNHVRMPHSPSSLYPVTETELRVRWELVTEALSTKISTSQQLEAAILHYNSKYSDRWDFRALHSFFSESLEEMETEYFFVKVLPKIIELALSLPKLVKAGLPLLRQHATQSVSLSQQQISCLLANAFLCTFPRRNTSKKYSEYSAFPDINFNRLFNGNGAEKKRRLTSLHEKLKCLVNYFRRVTSKVPDGVVTFSRHYVPPDKLPVWSNETVQLPNLYVSSEGTIEGQGTGMLEMDFANKLVGGGVLGHGCVQEEIRFVICPELILTRLFTEVLDDTEALIINGCETFSSYSGYAETFEWTGNVEDGTPRDQFGRRYCTLLALDASRFPSAKTQYTAAHINRELNKAYAGFSWGGDTGCRESIATGNWGCGAYRGDAYLKSLLQLMVAAVTGRDLAYFTFGNEELRDKLHDMHSFLTHRRVTVGELWKVITSYNPFLYKHGLYDHIYASVNTGSIPTPIKQVTPLAKKPRVQENLPNSIKKQEVEPKLSSEEIMEQLMGVEDLWEETGSVKTVEAKTLNVQKDKDLCLQRLSSSWTNLNESKRDFGDPSKNPEPMQDAANSEGDDASRQSCGRNKKKKISDYFQTVSKS